MDRGPIGKLLETKNMRGGGQREGVNLQASVQNYQSNPIKGIYPKEVR